MNAWARKLFWWHDKASFGSRSNICAPHDLTPNGLVRSSINSIALSELHPVCVELWHLSQLSCELESSLKGSMQLCAAVHRLLQASTQRSYFDIIGAVQCESVAFNLFESCDTRLPVPEPLSESDHVVLVCCCALQCVPPSGSES
eukprot:20595-Heterococcus_DN1.PRE.2